MTDLLISLDEVKNFAQKINSANMTMYDHLLAMKKEMDTLASGWTSKGSEEIRERFHLFSNRFDSEYEKINEYVKFLNLTVDTYEALETSISANAENMQY